MKFTTRFNELKEENNLTQTTIANKLNTTQQTIGRWLKGENEPDISNILKLANIFNCSIDYLLGREAEDGIVLINNEISEDETNLLDIVRQLNNINKEMVYTFAKLALENQNKAK